MTAGEGDYVADNVTVVTINFQQEFIRPSETSARDILLILDSSASISEGEFNTTKEGIKLLIDALCGGFGPNDYQNHLAILQFSTETEVLHRFSDDQSPETLKEVVDNARHMAGVTCTGSALRNATELWATGGEVHYGVLFFSCSLILRQVTWNEGSFSAPVLTQSGPLSGWLVTANSVYSPCTSSAHFIFLVITVFCSYTQLPTTI